MCDILTDVLANVEVDLTHLLHVEVIRHNHVEALQEPIMLHM